MLFKRRTTPSFLERARAMAWPTRSFPRSARYFVKRTMRINASPYAIAMGVACGAFASFTPLLGLHFVIAFAATYLLRGNFIGATIGTVVGNPLTFPFIWASTYRVGQAMLGQTVEQDAEPVLNAPNTYTYDGIIGFVERTWPVIQPMLIGSVPLGLTAATICFFLSYGASVGYQRAKAVRRAAAQRTKASETQASSVQPAEAS